MAGGWHISRWTIGYAEGLNNARMSKPALLPPPDSLLARLESLYEQGLMLQAFAVASSFAPLRDWTGTRARIWAGRLAANLGAPRLSRAFYRRAWRENRQDVTASAYHTYGVLERRGPLAAWEFLESLGEPAPDSDPDGRLYLFTLRGRIAGLYRDFENAEAWLERARSVDPTSPWLATEDSFLLEQQDRYEEALEAARRSLERNRYYRPGIMTTAHVLQLLQRHDEALALLREASAAMESGHVYAQLGGLEEEHQRYADALASYDRFETLTPLAEKDQVDWLNRQRTTLACHLGQFERALKLASQIDEPYYRELAERLAQSQPNQRRVRLKVPFVRQHHLTCAPATLSAISHFWNTPAEHLDLAEAICYDGTPAHSERHWAESNGWLTREFTITWEAAVRLLDRGLPFTLTTTEATSAHLQSVIGYDDLRATLLIRDPYSYHVSEVIAKPFLERYQATGPRGMVLVPEARGNLLDDIDLPDDGLYDHLYQVQRHLFLHQRQEAQRAVDSMQSQAPAHRLTLTAQRALAGYDANTPATLQCLDQWLKQYPKDQNLNLSKLSCLRELGRREERLALLDTLCQDKANDPIFYQQYAQELRSDGRERRAAFYWLHQALRCRPLDSDVLTASADFFWDDRHFSQATARYRLAACLNDKREYYAHTYFIASRHLKETDLALNFLRERWRRHGSQSSQPAITLFECLCQIDQVHEAFRVLELALQQRPDDSNLLLFAADAHARYGQYDQANTQLQAAQGKTQQTAWLRLAARLADYRNDRTTAQELWRSVLAQEPLAVDANRALAQLLAETQGRAAALSFLQEVCQRFPHHYQLHLLWIDWLREESAQQREPVLRHLADLNPADAYMQRELALGLSQQGRFEEAIQAADLAVLLEPQNSYGYCTRGDLFLARGQTSKAKAQFQTAIQLAIDNGYAVRNLLETCHTLPERKDALAFIEKELVRQTVFGEGLFAYRDAARGVLEPEDALRLFQDAHRARPDLWSAWSILILQLTDMRRYDAALEVAREANEKFPLLPRLWLDRARLHHARLEPEQEIEALNKALAINPSYSDASRLLSAVHDRLGQFEQARAALETACARVPLDPINHGCLAEVLWRLARKEEAIERVQHALRLNPGYDWGWRALRGWGAEMDKPGLAAELARTLTQERGGEARSWLILGQMLAEQDQFDACVKALDQAIALNPHCVDAWDLKARMFAQSNRFEEAFQCCTPPGFESPPVELEARAAWIEAQRGNIHRAIAKMRTALEHHPGVYMAWQTLAEWCQQINDLDQAIQAAARMAQLDPLNPVPLGYSGNLKLRKDDRAGAIADFQRAFQLDPAYGFAGFSLFDLQLEDRNFSAAEQTLATLQQHIHDDFVKAREGQWAAATGDYPRALRVLKDLCLTPTQSPWCIQTVADALTVQSQGRAADRVLQDALEQPEANPHLGDVWVRRRVAKGQWGFQRVLSRLRGRGEIGRLAFIAYVELLGDRYTELKAKRDVFGPWVCRFHFKRLLHRHRAWMSQDDLIWGKVGYTLTCLGKPTPVVRWLSDWRRRSHVETWMLYNLTLCLLKTKRHDEAHQVIRHALGLQATDETYPRLKAWAAFEEAVQGNVEAARKLAADVDPETVPSAWKTLLRHAEAMIALEAAPPPERRGMLGETCQTIRECYATGRPASQEQWPRIAYWRTIRRLAKLNGSFVFSVWGAWYYLGLGWLVVLLLATLAALWITWPVTWVALGAAAALVYRNRKQ